LLRITPIFIFIELNYFVIKSQSLIWITVPTA